MSGSLEIEKIYPLSPLQEVMLFHTLKDDGRKGIFCIQSAYLLEGELDVELLEMSFNHLIQRYDIFRTIFFHKQIQRPRQVVLKERLAKITFQDLAYLNNDQKTTYIDALKQDDREKGFDLSMDIPIRISIIKTTEKQYQIFITFHHIIMDGWCQNIIVRELLMIYFSLKENRALELDPVYPYSEYLKWLSNRNKETARKFWMEYLEGYQQLATLPTISSRYDRKEYIFKEMIIDLEINQTEQFKEITKQNRVTLSSLFQTIWGILLQKYNHVNDVVFGTVTSGRPPEIFGVEKMVGLFINTIPLRIKCSQSQSFIELLHEVHQASILLKEHDYLPFAEIQANSTLKSGLIDHIFIFENYPTESGKNFIQENALGFHIKDWELFDPINYDFNVNVIPNQPLTVRLSYNGLLYDQEFIRILINNLHQIMNAIIENHHILIKDIKIFCNEKSLFSGNQVSPHNEYLEFNKADINMPIAKLFEAQVAKYPGKTAAKMGKDILTYEALNHKINQVSWEMLNQFEKRNLTLHSENTVLLLFEHGLDMLTGIFSVLKAGSIYVPLDPTYPEERLLFIIRDSKARFIVTNNSNLSFARKLCQAITDEISIINITNINPGTPIENPNLPIDPNQIAYLLYTSGSTGNPKGVIQNQRNVLHFICNYTNKLHINSSDRLTLFSSYVFDASIMDIFGALLNGASIYPYNLKTETGVQGLSKWLIDEEITIYHSIPTVYRYFIDTLTETEKFPKVRLVILGGEAVFKKDVEQYKKYFADHCIFVNGLGPTESTVTLQYFMDRNTEVKGNSVPVGYPVDDTEVYLIDTQDEEVSVFGIGEIIYKSDHLALGYWNLPQKTNEVFTTDIRTGEGRVYHSGDLGRLLPDGSIEFIGRNDFQVKIRGNRVELAEIETIIDNFEGIKKSVVISFKGQNNEEQLAAYYTMKAGTAVAIDKLQKVLIHKLPYYMMPSYFIPLEKLPETLNGKIDRNALVLPIDDHPGNICEAPVNSIEEELLIIWRDLLNRTAIGTGNNFFDLGGNSLQLIQMHAKIEQLYPGKVTITDLFINPTIKKLARYIETTLGNFQPMTVSPLVIPAQFFIQGNQKESVAIFKIKLESQILTKINQIATSNNVTPGDFLLAGYIHSLSEISSTNEITVQTLVDRPGEIISLYSDLSSLGNFDDLLVYVSHERKIRRKSLMYDVTALGQMKFTIQPYAILPLFGNRLLFHFSEDIRKHFDIILSFFIEEATLQIELDYNQQRLKKAKMKIFSERYIELLNIIINIMTDNMRGYGKIDE